MDIEKLESNFSRKYGGSPRIFRAPGRVNLIGEHTDYNDGFVMPCAIDFAAFVAASRREDRKIRVASMNFSGEYEFDLDHEAAGVAEGWARYVQGVALILERSGFSLRGANLLIDSSVPVGAGLSSSAALEVSVGFALSAISGAIFVVLADTVARVAIAPRELPVGAVTALIGAPMFIYLLRKN